ncbi:MAG: hypothetical protein L6R38_004990 [Xanthoria sp. 2 TBL-2021]|nr:MAG: hypothetical protein L6R38_004990 [Xanthoria sp. 2 TBL-2021]
MPTIISGTPLEQRMESGNAATSSASHHNALQLPPIHSSAGQGLSNMTAPHPVRALPSFTNLTGAIKELPPHTAQWPSAQTLEYTGPVPVLPPIRDTAVPAALRPGHSNFDTRTNAQDANVNFEPSYQPRPGMYDRSTVQQAQQDSPYPHNSAPARQNTTVQATAGPQITILPRPRPSSNISPPLPNSNSNNYPMSYVWSGRSITIDGPYWDAGRKQPLSGDKSYLNACERHVRRTARREAREAMVRYNAPEWLVQASDSEEEGNW